MFHKLKLYTYWSYVFHIARAIVPIMPSTFPVAAFVAIVGEFMNLFVKRYPDRMNDVFTHWLPLAIVWCSQGAVVSRESVGLLLATLLAYFVFHGCSATRIHSLYQNLP